MKHLSKITALAAVALISASPATHADKPSRSAHPALTGAPAAKAATAIFAVSKMHCEGCATGLIQAAKGWPGVKSADVSFAQKRALVTFDPKKTNSARIAKEFARIGFPAKLVH